MEAFSGWKGDRLFANSSELTNSLQSSISGSREYEAVVFPAPLHPDMIYSLGIINIYVKSTKTAISVLLNAFSGFKRTKTGFFVLLRPPFMLFVGDSVSEKGEVPEAWVIRPYFAECVRNLLCGHDVLLTSFRKSEDSRLFMYMYIQRKDKGLFV